MSSELCLVKFASNENARVHFKGVQHENRIRVAHMNAMKENAIWCELCCCEMNTPLILEAHKQSPKHLKKAQALDEIMKMKEEYLTAKSNKSTSDAEQENPVKN